MTDSKNGQILSYPVASGTGIPNVMAGNFIAPGGVSSPGPGKGGFRVAKPGFDVRTATPDQLIFNSDQNVFKIVKTDSSPDPTYSVPFISGQYSTGSGVISKAHGLLKPDGTGYTPAIIAYIQESSTKYLAMPYSQFNGIGNAAQWLKITADVDDTNVYIRTSVLCYNQGASAGGSFLIKYYLLQETAN